MRQKDKIEKDFWSQPHHDASRDGLLLEVLLDIRELLLDKNKEMK